MFKSRTMLFCVNLALKFISHIQVVLTLKFQFTNFKDASIFNSSYANKQDRKTKGQEDRQTKNNTPPIFDLLIITSAL